MRVFTAIFIASAIVFAASAYAIPKEDDQQSSGSATWTALTNWFTPVTNYFSETLPDQSPSDIVDNLSQSVSDAHKWTQENTHIDTVVQAVKPYWESAKDTASNLSQTTFSDMYDGVSNGVKNLDEQIGGYINEWNKQR